MFLGNGQEDWRTAQYQRQFVEELKDKQRCGYKFFCGIDLGRTNDRSVIACLQEKHDRQDDIKTLELIGLDILPSGMNFIQKSDYIRSYLDRRCFEIWGVDTILDESGLGSPVADYLRSKDLKFKGAVITSGDGMSRHKGQIRVARNYLFKLLVKALNNDNFRLASNLKHAHTLESELLALSSTYGKQNSLIISSSKKDDTVISLCLSMLAEERSRNGLRCGVTTLY